MAMDPNQPVWSLLDPKNPSNLKRQIESNLQLGQSTLMMLNLFQSMSERAVHVAEEQLSKPCSSHWTLSH